MVVRLMRAPAWSVACSSVLFVFFDLKRSVQHIPLEADELDGGSDNGNGRVPSLTWANPVILLSLPVDPASTMSKGV